MILLSAWDIAGGGILCEKDTLGDHFVVYYMFFGKLAL